MNRSLAVTLAVVAFVVFPVGLAQAADTDSPAVPGPAPAPLSLSGSTTTAPPAPAGYTSSAPKSPADFMTLGRNAVAKSDWKGAIVEFKKAVTTDPKDADANNMLAYSYRKSGDLTNAFAFYKVALTINPKHRGALEYQGEAYVMAGKLSEAKANLGKLKTVCGATCAEYKDLAATIAKAPKPKKK